MLPAVAGSDAFERFPQERLLVQSARIFCYFLVLILALMVELLQEGFVNWGLLQVFYSTVFFGITFHFLHLFFLEKFFKNRVWLLCSFIFDVILVTVLTVKSDLNQSLFLFLFLVIIVLSGVVLRKQGAFLLALICSIAFTFVSLLGPELKTMSVLFLVVLNNIAFFVVAWLSGYLSDQFSFLGERLESQTLNLQTVRKLNELIIETIPSGLVTTSQKDEVLLFNLGAEQMLGSKLISGCRLSEIVPDLEINFQKENQKSTEILVKSDESMLAVEKRLRITRLRQQSDSILEMTYLYVLEDLTEIRRLESQVRQSEKLAAVGQLAAGIAHEIRNPLAGISGSIELLSQTSNNEDDRKLTKIILREIDRLNNLISEFLEYAKPDQRLLDSVDLGALIDEVLNQAKVQQPLNLRLLKNSLSAPVLIRGNRDKLKQAFLNIIINAYQAMAKTENPTFEVGLSLDEGRRKLLFKDNGSGMSEAVRLRIFEPFMTTKPKGTGLGLAITHKILETHGAHINVESSEGRGTQFTIEFQA